MNETCPTVRVKADNESGFALINESDFDAQMHELFDTPDELEQEKPKRGRPAKVKD